MVRSKDSFWAHAEETENGRSFICKFCKKTFAGGISRIKSHLSGVSGRDIRSCPQVPESIQLEAKQALLPIEPPSKRTKNVVVSNNFLEGEIISGSMSSHMPNLSNLDKKFAQFFIWNSICPNVFRSPFFKDFMTGVVEHGPGYELPSPLTLRSQLIPDIKKEVVEYVKNVIKNSAKTGCTLMWNRNFDNVFLYTPTGVVLLDLPDFPEFERIMSIVMMFTKPANLVQFIINDVVRILHQRVLNEVYPSICQTPCATRGIKLLGSKLCSLPFMYNTLRVSMWIVSCFYRHKVNVSLRRVHKMKGTDASYFFTLISLLEVESELQALQTPIAMLFSDWDKLLNDSRSFDVAKFISYAINCKEFWSRGKIVAQVMRPLFQALSLVHCDSPTSGYLYEMMERLQDAIHQCCFSNQALYNDIRNILTGFRSDIIHPIHAAAALLNPIYMLSEKFKENFEMLDGISYIREHLVMEEDKEAFNNQVELYRMKDSKLFTATARMMLETSHPRIWWESCGNPLPVLQKYAIQILSQPCSSTLCKRHNSWSDLQESDLEEDNDYNHAFMVNTTMMERYKSLETQMTQPIILDKLGYDDFISQDLLDEDTYFDEDRAWNMTYDELELEIVNSELDDIVKDSTGSWLDWWPRKAI